MKFFKHTLSILIILLFIQPITAKQTGAAKPTTQSVIAPMPPNTLSPSKRVPARSAAGQANAEINAELAKIEKSQNAIKDSAYRVLNDTKIN